jgi:hypothetical protein
MKRPNWGFVKHASTSTPVAKGHAGHLDSSEMAGRLPPTGLPRMWFQLPGRVHGASRRRAIQSFPGLKLYAPSQL